MTGPLPTGEAKTARVRSMFDAIAPRYDLLNRLITFGLDQRWRRATVRALGLPPGSRVLDLACGTGDLTLIAGGQSFGVVGTDLSAGMLAARRHDGPAVQCDAAALGLATGAFDGVVSGYALRNFTDLRACLQEAARVLRPGGRIAVLEVARPRNRWWRAGFHLWFDRMVPLIGGLLSDREAYRYLPRSTAYLPDDPALRALFRDAGFSTVGRRLLYGGLSQLLTGTRTGMPPGSPEAGG
ncbi:MAG: ubiquinone/menaquinone biosynthesis methyltransferase [Acidimicrobiales bacterium]